MKKLCLFILMLLVLSVTASADFDEKYDQMYSDPELQSAYEAGVKDGYYGYADEIYYEGYESGIEEGEFQYDNGFDDGYEEGIEEGYEQGYDSGYSDGYSDGEDDDYYGNYNSGYPVKNNRFASIYSSDREESEAEESSEAEVHPENQKQKKSYKSYFVAFGILFVIALAVFGIRKYKLSEDKSKLKENITAIIFGILLISILIAISVAIESENTTISAIGIIALIILFAVKLLVVGI